MNAKQRRTTATLLVAWGPSSTVAETATQLLRQSSPTTDQALVAARLRNVGARLSAIGDAIESGRSSDAVTAQLTAGCVDTLVAIMADLVVAR